MLFRSFYWHRRRTQKTGHCLAGKVKIEVSELEQESFDYDDDLNPVVVYGATASYDLKAGKEFDLDLAYGWKIVNNCAMSLYPALFYFDNSDWSISEYRHQASSDDADNPNSFLAPYYLPPITVEHSIVEPPLKGKGHLTVGYGDSGSVPHTFYLRPEQNVDVGILKLFLSRQQVSLSHVAQPSPFLAHRAVGPPPEFKNLHLPWDTIDIPVVQRRAD